MKEIKIIIDETGETSIDLAGYHGKGCAKVLEDFTSGDKLKVIREKREYNEQPIQQKEKQR